MRVPDDSPPPSESPPLLRFCAYVLCHALLVTKPFESARSFARRQTCGHQCSGPRKRTLPTCPDCFKRLRHPEHRCRPRGAVNPFPGAGAVTYQEAPARCPRCGGPWRWVADGVRCVLCSRTVVIAEALLSVFRHAGAEG